MVNILVFYGEQCKGEVELPSTMSDLINHFLSAGFEITYTCEDRHIVRMEPIDERGLAYELFQERK